VSVSRDHFKNTMELLHKVSWGSVRNWELAEAVRGIAWVSCGVSHAAC